MKKIEIFLLDFYQIIISPFIHQVLGVGHACRYSPTCSEYAKIHIAQDGALIGTMKSLRRLLYCHPFAHKLPASLQK